MLTALVPFLVIVNDLSSFIWVKPMKRNKAAEVLEIFKQIYISSERFPAMLTTDAGSEFCANIFEEFLNSRHTVHHIAKPPLKAQVQFFK